MNLLPAFRKPGLLLMTAIVLFWTTHCFSASSGTLKWYYKTGGMISGKPAVDKTGTIYVGSDDSYLYALNTDGTLKWRFKTGSGIGSGPVIASDGTIYCGSDDFYLYAVNPDGTQKWKTTTTGWPEGSPVIGPDGTIYVGDNTNRLHAVSNTGTVTWTYFTGGGEGLSTPALGLDGTIYFSCGNRDLFALNPDGTLKWKYRTSDLIHSSPAIGLDGTIYFGCDDSFIYAINPDNTLKWKYKTELSVRSSPVVSPDGTVYCGSADDYLYAIDSNGSRKWRFKTDSDIFGDPVLGMDGTVYCASHDNYIYGINANGSLKWNYLTGDCVYATPVLGLDGTLYCGSNDTYFYAIHNTIDHYYTMPVFKPQSGYWSGLGITNLSNDKSANVAVTIYGKTGTILASESRYIPAHGQGKFLIGTTLTDDGWIKITSDRPVAGMNLLGQYQSGSTDYFLADIPFVSWRSRSMVVPHTAQNANWDTIVFLANPNDVTAQVTLTHVAGIGAGAPPYSVTIPANGSKQVSVGVIGGSTAIQGGYVLISSTTGLTAFALYNNIKTGKSSYAGINAVPITTE
ncbi:MAG: hypothetical protein D3926_12055 [Desulfobacteraceae bacterium]|nr:MAG: hypothetical protein D3926_12055 [Desulfobacteraceae bacterium]